MVYVKHINTLRTLNFNSIHSVGSAFDEKVYLLILYMYHSPGAVEEFLIVRCMLIAHIHEGLYLYVKKDAFCLHVLVKLALLFMQRVYSKIVELFFNYKQKVDLLFKSAVLSHLLHPLATHLLQGRPPFLSPMLSSAVSRSYIARV